MLVMAAFFIAFRWIHLSTPLIRLFLLVLILQIGRASCRERVEIPASAGSFQKKACARARGRARGTPTGRGRGRGAVVLFFKQKTAYEIGLGIPAEPLFRS